MPKLGLTGGGFSSRSMRAERRGRTGSARPEDERQAKKKPAAEGHPPRRVRAHRGPEGPARPGLRPPPRQPALRPGAARNDEDPPRRRDRQGPAGSAAHDRPGRRCRNPRPGDHRFRARPRSSARPPSARSRRCGGRVQRHVGRLHVAFFDQTKTGILLSRVMTDAEGIRNLVGTGLVELAGGQRHGPVRPGNPLLLQRQADADRPRGPLALRPRPALRVQDPPAALPGALEDQRRGLRTPDRVLLGDPRRQGLPRRAPRGPRLHRGASTGSSATWRRR